MPKAASLVDGWAGPCLLSEDQLRQKRLRYDCQRYPFQAAAMAAIFGKRSLDGSSLPSSPSPPLHRALVQAHRKPAAAPASAQAFRQSDEWRAFLKLYDRFVEDWVLPQFECDCLVQCEPVLRAVLPGSVAPCKPHCDADYYHDASELNYWVPVTHVFGANTLWVESAPRAADFAPIEACVGHAIRFYGNRCRHFTLPNTSCHMRVSFDFRVIPAHLAAEAAAPIVTNRKLAAGGYYRLAKWRDPSLPCEVLGEESGEVVAVDELGMRACKFCGVRGERQRYSERQWRKPAPCCLECQQRIEDECGGKDHKPRVRNREPWVAGVV